MTKKKMTITPRRSNRATVMLQIELPTLSNEAAAAIADVLVQLYHRFEAAYYGHASVGCLHIRPIIDLKQDPEVEKLRSIAEQVSDLVLEFGGAMSAEHGDGLARSCWNEKLFGPTLYQAFRELKAAFDPGSIMNPGKILEPPPEGSLSRRSHPRPAAARPAP